jgi:signal peptidase I
MADTAESPAPAPARKQRSLARELVQTAILAALIFLGVRAALQNFRVEGESMYPTLRDSEYVLVDKADYLIRSPERGDIVVFRAVPALQPDRDFIKRVIGLPGEIVSVHDGGVYINGRRLHESYIDEPPSYDFAPRRVPPNDYFVLGDHRNDSFDSAKWPTTPWLARRYIIGKAWLAYWPLNLFGFLSTPW